MKYLILILICGTAHAEDFKFKMNGSTLDVKVDGRSHEDAFNEAAQKCWQFFIKQKPFSEEYGLDVIDHCANPNSKLLNQN